jgi:hypothetical protein
MSAFLRRQIEQLQRIAPVIGSPLNRNLMAPQ